MPLGFPLRTRNTIVEVYGELFSERRLAQLMGNSLPCVATASMSAARASVTTSACRPSITDRACLPDPPCDWLILTSCPVFFFLFFVFVVLFSLFCLCVGLFVFLF